MQPDSECNKRVRAKPGTPKSSTPRTQKAANNPIKLMADDGTPSTRNQNKTDIPKIISHRGRTLTGTSNRILQYLTPERKANIRDTMESPATVYLKKIESNTMMSSMISKTIREENESVLIENLEKKEQCVEDKNLVVSKTIKERKMEKDMKLNITETTPVIMDVSAMSGSPISKHNKSPKSAPTRRQSTRNKKNKLPNECTPLQEKSVIGIDNMNLTINEEENATILLAQPMEESINALCATLSTTCIPEAETIKGDMETPNAIIFDSARKPGRRRTLFDVSMDIISERLQNINRSARRSIMPIDTLTENDTSSPLVDFIDKKEAPNNAICTPINTLLKKKRKLFVPNNNDSSLLFGTPPPLSLKELNEGLPNSCPITENHLTKLTPRIEKKRRRTVMHCTPTVSAITRKNSNKEEENEMRKTDATTGTKLQQRRRTLMPIMKSTLGAAVCVKNDDDNNEVKSGHEEIKNIAVATKPTNRRRRTVISLKQPSPLPDPSSNRFKTNEKAEKIVKKPQTEQKKLAMSEKNNNVTNKTKTNETVSSHKSPPQPALETKTSFELDALQTEVPSISAVDNIKRAVGHRRSTLDFVDESKKQVAIKPKKVMKRNTNATKFMVFTNMHRQQCETIRQVGDASFLPNTVTTTISCGEKHSTT